MFCQDNSHYSVGEEEGGRIKEGGGGREEGGGRRDEEEEEEAAPSCSSGGRPCTGTRQRRLTAMTWPGVPTVSLLWESSLLSMALRIWREKTCLILHLRGLEEDSLGRKIWEEQRRFRWPGLAREASEISRKLVVDDPNTTSLSKQQYRAEVTKACHHFQEGQLRQKMKSKDGQIMKKCQKIEKDFYGRKPYFDNKVPSEVRSFFSTRVSMLPIAGNFRQDRRFARTSWLCRCGKEREEERHLTPAPSTRTSGSSSAAWRKTSSWWTSFSRY